MHLTQLGITDVATWRHITSFRNGLVLIAGPDGSGKTMTLNATVRELQGLEKCINTFPEAIAWRPPSYVQKGSRGPLDFAAGIKAFMRADPDVIILDEIRESIAARKAVQAAEAGHLVIATINAESVHMALHRLLGLGMNLEDLEVLLRGVLLQTLLPVICRNCSGTACDSCFGKGYVAQTLVSEIVPVCTRADVTTMIRPADDICIETF